MPNLLILIKQEEIPFSEDNFINSFIPFERNLVSSNAIFLELQITQETHFPAQQIIGPKCDAPQVAIEGFYKKYPHEMGFVITKSETNFVAKKEASTKTAEEIAPEIAKHNCQLHCVKLVETENNFVEYFG